MPCYNPLIGYRSKNVNENGKRPIVFKERYSDGTGDIPLPCGQCIGCRLEYSRQWALRCHHESQLHSQNAFITLTFDNDNLPENNSVNKPELQKFIKRLRKNSGCRLRYFACGEYGDRNNRPHYHAIIFGYGFPDKQLWSLKDEIALYRSPLLEQCWDKGFSTIGDVTFESAAYVARYVMKKRKGKPDHVDKHGKTNKEYYQLLDKETGEIHQLEPEFSLMSRRPGIGREWLRKYKGDTNKDFITLRGREMALPKYYDSILEAENPDEFLQRKEKRKEKINYEDGTLVRLRTKEAVKLAQLNQLKRGLETNGT